MRAELVEADEGGLTTVLGDGAVVLMPAVGLSVEQPASTATSEVVAKTAAVRRRTDRKVDVMSSRKAAPDPARKSLLMGVLIGHRNHLVAVVASLAWTIAPKSASS
jgi:hypothetical protein